MPTTIGRFTTPTVPVIIEGPDLSECDVYITFRQGPVSKTFKNPDSERYEQGGYTAYYCAFTQGDSARFRPGRAVQVQANAVDTEGYRVMTNIASAKALPNLLDVREDYV